MKNEIKLLMEINPVVPEKDGKKVEDSPYLSDK